MVNKEKIEFSPEKREKGKNIHLKISFHRHAEKTPQGELSELGLEQARKFGGEEKIPKSGLKVYTSPFRRTIDTAEQIIKGIEEQNQKQKIFTTRSRFELAPPQWEHFDVIREKGKEAEAKEGQKGLCKYILSEPLARKDLERWTSGLAYLINQYKRMTDRLYSNSDIELMHVTHDIVISDFLRKVAILKDDDGKRITLNDLEAIGGSIDYLKGFSFEIYSDADGNKHTKILFRDKEFEADEERLEELVNKFKEEPYKGRVTKQDWKQKENK